jgi:hypothetical protein
MPALPSSPSNSSPSPGASFPTGVVVDFFGSDTPDGWVMLSGGTIGDPSSGATIRANADCEALFALLWNSMGNGEAPVSGGRGADAASDWAAHKTITVPDARGRVIAGKDNMSDIESPAGRITTSGCNIDGTVLGTNGGAEGHSLTEAEIPTHTHEVAGYASNPVDSNHDSATTNALTDIGLGASGNTGGGTAHPNVQPTLIANKIIKL